MAKAYSLGIYRYTNYGESFDSEYVHNKSTYIIPQNLYHDITLQLCRLDCIVLYGTSHVTNHS